VTAVRSHLQPVTEDEVAQLGALLAGLRRGERQAVGALFDRFEREVNRLVWALLGADTDHDDLVNDAFEAMLKRAAEVRQPAALRAWVRQVTVNTVRMELRRRRWRRFFTRDEDAALEHPDLRVPDDAERERTRALYRALAALSADERLVVVLRHLEGLELTEVAEATGCSLATLKRRLSRAEARLGALLGASS
jgi:RNA polymerase sigma-70 factor (ECF subfamily)